jgi:hypothetical protein
MIDSRTPGTARTRRAVRSTILLATVAAAALLAGCAPKITQVDASYTMPEGTRSPDATLLVWADQPTFAYVYGDIAPADPDSTDTLQTAQPYQRWSPSTLHGLILDHTQADAFQMFRREGGGGVRQFVTYTAPKTRQWLQSEYEAYHFVDPAPSSYAPATYVARGVVEGVVNKQSPLTNLATVYPAPANITAKAVWWENSDPAKGPIFASLGHVISKIKLKWDPVPGAARYLVQVYEFRADMRSDQERILSGTPAPMYDGASTDLFIGYVPANVNFMFIGDSTRTDITTFQIKPMVPKNPYLVRIAALDANGHLLAVTQGDTNPIQAFTNGEMGLIRGWNGNGTYLLYRYGATTARDTVHTGGGGGGGGGGLG